LNADFLPEGGQTNPFLHLSLHLAILEQVTSDRPPGILAAFEQAARATGDAHAAEHRVMDCLAETLWEAQRSGLPPDEQAYLQRVRRLV
jgi:hypothetical protein